ncbi:MAG: pyruvate:ferredoxin (flavodoxin) oxidoreductase [Phycisphaerales bacterium]|nr:pyruvate:ferredoxin (flavodoxin) oxidoreductase [Phycisphaerales bacterium]
MKPIQTMLDGNEAVASVAYRLNEVIAIYPITPSTPMGEKCDELASRKRLNIYGGIPVVQQMQSEAGAAGALHGALQAGSLATTFTSSQGLLLMIPNMYKIAGELTPVVIHVAARTVATHALSIFGDHSDVMGCRSTGFAMLSSGNVQEASDFACIAQAAALRARVPFLHFFDGFRTSHEIARITPLTDEDLRSLTDEGDLAAHRRRALSPDHPVLRGSAQNPDAFFQAREAANGFYDACPKIVQEAMDRFAQRTGRAYHLFDYHGSPTAERVIIIMGSGAETVRETVDHLNARGANVGVLVVRLFRPFCVEAFLAALPASVKSIAVLDRCKEPGAIAEPLHLDVMTALHECWNPRTKSAASGNGKHRSADGLQGGLPNIIGGRYGLSSKEFTPAMVKAVFDELAKESPKRRFTVGIVDDVTHLSLNVDETFDIEPDDVVRAVFFGLGADGTVGANKNSIKIIGEQTDNHAQGYFVYDSKKSGAITISHLRFGPRPIRAPYLICRANFVACHQFEFLSKYDVLEYAAQGAVLLLNAPFRPERVWDELPRDVQEAVIEKGVKIHVINANEVARKTGMGGRINTIMQACFFGISGVLPREEAIAQIKEAIRKTYQKQGDEVVRRNCLAVDESLSALHEVTVPNIATSKHRRPPLVSDAAPDFVKKVTALMLANKGDLLPVSAFPVDGTWPTATAKWEKRNIALDIPIWDPKLCIQCNKCAMVCPHAAIRVKAYDPECVAGAPQSFLSVDYIAKDLKGHKYTVQVAPEDCTGCKLCVAICPAKDKSNPKRKAINMESHAVHRDRERVNYDFFLDLPEFDASKLSRFDVKGVQLLQPLFEYSGACAGCGETPYIKLMTQLFGDRALISNATGCSSIYGGNLPTTPYTVNRDGRGPAWSNSLFEDNAEFGLGYRLAIDSHRDLASALLKQLAGTVGENLVTELLNADQSNEAGLRAQRERVVSLRKQLAAAHSGEARLLTTLADYLVKKSIWIVGGDGWAYDIGYGGLDHVLSLDRDVNLLVLDTEVYSNTGGQSSKATPVGAAAKFAVTGKAADKKDLGLMAMSYGNVYVASVAFGANDNHTVKAFMEAESYSGPSLIIAYSHCIAHGYDMQYGLDQQTRAVQSGVWPLYRYDPRRALTGEPPLVLDAKPAKTTVEEYMRNETRFRMVEKMDAVRFRWLARKARESAARRVAVYEHLAKLRIPQGSADPGSDGHLAPSPQTAGA